MSIPDIIVARHDELVRLCEEHPIKMPLEKAAEFLGMDREGLRSSIDQGRCQFGLCVQKSAYGNRAFTICTTAFYSWATGGAAFRSLKVEKLKEGKNRRRRARRAQ